VRDWIKVSPTRGTNKPPTHQSHWRRGGGNWRLREGVGNAMNRAFLCLGDIGWDGQFHGRLGGVDVVRAQKRAKGDRRGCCEYLQLGRGR